MDNLIDWFYSKVVGFLGNFFAAMGNLGVELFEMLWVQAVVQFFSQLGWALFGVSVVVCCFECGLEYSTGRGNIQQTAVNILKGFMAVSLFTTVPVRLYTLSVTLQGKLSAGITGYGTGIGAVGEQIIEDLTSVESLADMMDAPSFGLSVLTSPIMLLFCIIPGTEVTHKLFGRGIVMSRDGDVAVISFREMGVKRISLPLCLRQEKIWLTHFV